ncbi:hypothetical protein B0T24DRAFT_642175 [Lasiosphaeria ovina]|uniref:Uncharacterized protein n=1 Tax=Lasiosphaeria ovina TaxID=92902 RepID=A0AAE0MZT2_9PEZI|nr:hypothetical protein B0T24DRAFT_642175 [Lasiosphaeria ovina]
MGLPVPRPTFYTFREPNLLKGGAHHHNAKTTKIPKLKLSTHQNRRKQRTGFPSKIPTGLSLPVIRQCLAIFAASASALLSAFLNFESAASTCILALAKASPSLCTTIARPSATVNTPPHYRGVFFIALRCLRVASANRVLPRSCFLWTSSVVLIRVPLIKRRAS